MFNHYYIKDDPFNKNNFRNVANTPKYTYNCAGYALETFSWYCPNEDTHRYWRYDFTTEEQAWKITLAAVDQMVRDFEGKLRRINSLEELRADIERVVAFRISSDGDFHYIKKGANGHWYHKRGSAPYIDEMSAFEVFNTDWCDRYDGPIILLAIKK